MFISNTQLTDLTLHSPAGDFKITDAGFDTKNGDLRYVIVDNGGWFRTSEILVPFERLEALSLEDAIWHARLYETDLEAQENAEEGDPAEVDLRGLPPILTGPFGYTYAPPLLGAQLADLTRETHAALPDGTARLSEWIDREVYGRDGPIAKITGAELDTQARSIRHMQVSMDGEVFALPFNALRNFVKEGYVVTDLSSEDIRAGFVTAEPGLPLPEPASGWVSRNS
ncbi:hypothetical protein HKCCE4037_15995 [Rhodobacterales bacterium HKCCE4037]|nr:hypothetical protein [Rhodobacterales bacterium HKCCE4037]